MNKLWQNLAFTLMHELLIIGFSMKLQAIGLNGLLANLMLPAKENEAAAVFLMSKILVVGWEDQKLKVVNMLSQSGPNGLSGQDVLLHAMVLYLEGGNV